MATVLGKRKKPEPPAAAGATDDAAAIQDIFRRHFEAQFKPLAGAAKTASRRAKSGRAKASKGNPRGGAAVVVRENDSDSDGSSSADDDDDDSSIEEDSEDDWSGISDEEDGRRGGAAAASVVEVFDYSAADAARGPETAMTKHERKLYLSSRPPASFDDDDGARKNKSRGATAAAAAAADGKQPLQYKDAPDLLANDLALQRLISESHLLAGAFALPSSLSTSAGAVSGSVQNSNSGSSSQKVPFAAGRLRQRATDLRIQAVANKARGDAGLSDRNNLITRSSAKDSIFTQAKMPMARRKGIAAAAAAREAKRRKEARENGIVLERPGGGGGSGGSGTARRHRQRAVDAPAVGRMHGSELRLRERDVREIEGPKKSMAKNKKKRRR